LCETMGRAFPGRHRKEQEPSDVDSCPGGRFLQWGLVGDRLSCYAGGRIKEVANAHRDRDHCRNASRLLLGVLGARVWGLVVRRRLLGRRFARVQPVRHTKERIRIAALGRMILVSSLLLLLVFGVVQAQDRERFASETGLDIDLVNVIEADVGGAELAVIFVFINERTFDSKISASLRATLLPYLGRNAVYVNPNVKTVTSQFPFDPLMISVQPSGEATFAPRLGAWVEITPGFLGGRFEVNPAGSSQGSGAEGILVLEDAIDPDQPFDMIYMGQRTTFVISVTAPSAVAPIPGAYAAATESHAPIEVPLLEDVATLEEILGLPDFSSESMAALFDLDTDAVRAAETTFSNGEVLRFLFVRLDEGVRDSALGEELIAALDPVIGTGAVMVWAFSPTGVGFSSRGFQIHQSEKAYEFWSSASFVELTAGFIHVEYVEAGQMVAAVIRLPQGVEPDVPFVIQYASTRVRVSFP